MKILGNRVYLSLPDMPDNSGVKLLPETEAKMKEEMREKFDRLTIFAVGEINLPSNLEPSPLKVGDEVLVDPNAVRRGVIFKVEGKEKMCVDIRDVMHIW